ncbi:MAG: UbiA family prenyltransferase [Blastocatellia bacterium]
MADQPVPLCVDLDGALIKTNTLHEAVVALILANPWLVCALPFWLMRGQAYLWQRLSERVMVNPETLPYRPEALAYLKREKESGREIILISGAHKAVVRKVAGHLGFFDDAFGSDESLHLVGSAKLAAIARRYGDGSFDYLGDSRADLPIWKECRQAIIVSRDRALVRRLRRNAPNVEVIEPTGKSRIRAAVAALRPHQWSKNLLLFAALFLGHKFNQPPVALAALAGFVIFSLGSSAIYVLNDLTDLEADRLHASKKKRPFAAGDLSAGAGLLLAISLVAVALTLAPMLSVEFAMALVGYLALAVLYTFYLKEKLLVDIFTLAGFYTIRVWAGGASTGIAISHWALAFFMCLSLSLALAKRYAELAAQREDGLNQSSDRPFNRRGYRPEDGQFIMTLGCASALMSVLVVALYINSPDVLRYYRRPALLWLICPALAYWASRIWLIASRGELNEDTVLFAIKDRVSYLVGAVIVITVLLSI